MTHVELPPGWLRRGYREREKKRVDYVLGILQKAKRLEDISNLFAAFKNGNDYEANPSVERMIGWTEKWIGGERQQISPASIEAELAKSKLFDDHEPEFDFDPKTWASSLFDMDEFEYVILHELDDKDTFGEEVIEWDRRQLED